MNATAAQLEHPDYGIDAPGVVRNLLVIGAIGLLTWGTAALGLWSGQFVIPVRGQRLIFPLTGMGLWGGIGCTLMGIWMLWDSKIGKVKNRERLLQRVTWTGHEQVLDVGCGRGLMLIGAAKRLATGKAIGIDVWQAEDLSGNSRDATLENARREGVAERVEVQTADMRRMPFADNTFDVVVSRAAIHNLYQASDRAQAISEIARVLKPGGRALIEDIRHHRGYAAVFAQNGCSDIRRVGSPVVSVLLMLLTFGSLRPATLVVRKSA